MPKPEISQPFKGRKLVIATMHQKERVIAPLLKKHLGAEIIVPRQFNTDKFGTFTREIKRAGSQLETARKKAYAAMASEGVDLGVSSEGSFDMHPSIPFVQSNLELVLFIDKKNRHEIRGHHRTQETNIDGQYVRSAKEALDFAKKIGFPEHGIILRKNKDGRRGIYKNIQTAEELVQKANKMFSGLFTKRIFVEADMRAHRNPTRMKAIEKATEDLIKNIASLCPKCRAHGFSAVDFEKGLKCALCNAPTDLPLYEIYLCDVCRHLEKKLAAGHGAVADSQHCEYCNP